MMPFDTFICGACDGTFNDIVLFIQHKKECDGNIHSKQTDSVQETSTDDNTPPTISNELTSSVDEVVPVLSNEVEETTSNLMDHISFVDGTVIATLAVEEGISSAPIDLLTEASRLAGIDCSDSNINPTFVIVAPAEISPVKVKRRPRRPKSPAISKEESKPPLPEKGEDGRFRCVRCKRSFIKDRHYNTHRCMASSDYVELTNKDLFKLEEANGTSVYMDVDEDTTTDPDFDIAASELETGKVNDSIEDEDEEDEDDDDADGYIIEEDEEYKAPYNARAKLGLESRKRGRPHKHVPVDNVDEEAGENAVMTERVPDEITGDGGCVQQQDGDMHKEDLKTPCCPCLNRGKCKGCICKNDSYGCRDSCRNPLCQYKEADDDQLVADSRNLPKRKRQLDNIQVTSDPDNIDADNDRKLSLSSIKDVPIFTMESDKLAFEQSLNVDLSALDHMYSILKLEQDLNEHAFQARQTDQNFLLYSCKTCEKVFKTVSHMRVHCLTHTSLRPFKCIKCDYCSNSKGNLYTHMRKHTGQFYQCTKCKFKTINKTHLFEHQATHMGKKHQCEICKKKYNTKKSLQNHVRKYHANAKGEEYLQKFMARSHCRGVTVIHQCHVCNRKFKKKIDRDRHLFTHDIHDMPHIQRCDLCDYVTTRRIYLEKHVQKHRVIYRCSECQERFLSTFRLITHLTSVHCEKDVGAAVWEILFEKSIANSMYLPEPKSSMLVNLPSELASDSANDTQVHVVNNASLTNNNSAHIPSTDIPRERTNISVVDPVTESLEASQSVSVEAINQIHTPSSVETVPPIDLHVDSSTAGTNSNASTDAQDTLHSVITGIDVSSQQLAEVGSNNIPNPGVKDGDELTELDAGVAEDVAIAEALNVNSNGVVTCRMNDAESLKSLGFHAMTMDLFQKMHYTFGNEECEYCGKLFFSKNDYENHIKTHTGQKPHSCSLCSYTAITRDNLRRHVEVVHEKVMIKCKECEFKAANHSQLWLHQLEHRSNLGRTCPKCAETFTSVKLLRCHIQSIHPDIKPEDVVGYQHTPQGKMGRKSYKCPYCDKVFVRAFSELQKHIWIHEEIKPFKCNLCPHSCRSKTNLQSHMLRHSPEKPFVCGECGKAYKSRTALRWHVRSHREGKLFKCEKCNYEASQSSHLKRHMEVHTLSKRFPCQHCDFTSNAISHLRMHYTRAHPNVKRPALPDMVQKIQPGSAPTYRCLTCDYLFGNFSDLKRHLKTRHHKPVTMEIQKSNADLAATGVTAENTVGGIVSVQSVPQSEFYGIDVGTEQIVMAQDYEQQVIQISEAPQVASEETTTTVQVLQNNGEAADNMDPKTASAVQLLQQIIDMSEQGTGEQHYTIHQSENSETMGTIILQQHGPDDMMSNSCQYVIQYINHDEQIVTPEETLLSNVFVQENSLSAPEETVTVQETISQSPSLSNEGGSQQIIFQSNSENNEVEQGYIEMAAMDAMTEDYQGMTGTQDSAENVADSAHFTTQDENVAEENVVECTKPESDNG